MPKSPEKPALVLSFPVGDRPREGNNQKVSRAPLLLSWTASFLGTSQSDLPDSCKSSAVSLVTWILFGKHVASILPHVATVSPNNWNLACMSKAKMKANSERKSFYTKLHKRLNCTDLVPAKDAPSHRPRM
jgi:hypothetical protein